MIKHTQLKVPMTQFIIDVLIGGEKEEHEVIQKRLYDVPDSYIKEITRDECNIINVGPNGIIPEQKIFHLHLNEEPIKNIPVTVHELWHIMWLIQNVIPDFTLTYESHAFAAPMIEDIIKQLLEAEYELLSVDSEGKLEVL